MNRSQKAQLTEGPVGRTLIRLTIPMILGIAGMVAFNLADTYFVGQLGTDELAALSFTFPVVLVVSSIAMGLGIGASAVISRAIGERRHGKVRRLTTDSLILSLMIVAFVAFVGLFTIRPLFTLLGASAGVLELVSDYMSIWYLAVIFVVIPMVGNNAIRATGDTKTPSIVMLVAVGVNIALDPLLIFGWGPVPALGVQGAAIATAVSRATTLAVSLYILHYREQMIAFERPAFSALLDSWRKILYIGLPAAATNMVIPISIGIITGLVATYGNEAVAALGVSSRLEMFTIAIIMALGSVIAPFVGQNLGAGKLERVRLGMRYSFGFSLVWGTFMYGVYVLFAEPVAAVFNDDPMVIETIRLYLYLVPLSYGFQGVLMLATAALNVLNKPLHSAALSVTRMFVLYVPLAYLLSLWLGLAGIFGAAAVANVAAGILAYWAVQRQVGQPEAFPLPEVQPVAAQPTGD